MCHGMQHMLGAYTYLLFLQCMGEQSAAIKLLVKVLTKYKQLCNTLCHKLCHATA